MERCRRDGSLSEGVGVLQSTSAHPIPSGWVELVELPGGGGITKSPGPHSL